MLRWLPRVAIALTSVAASTNAQPVRSPVIDVPGRLESSWPVPAAFAARSQQGTRSSLLLEALGGSVGSAVGISLILLVSECGVDDLACEFLTVGAAGAAGVLGATLGTALVARQAGARHSTPGAVVGAVLGTGIGLGVHYLLNRNSDRNLGDMVVVPIFAISQGVFAAIGGRW
jgi:hypothetical protein